MATPLGSIVMRIGLDYPACEAVMRLHGIADMSSAFEQLQIIEHTILQCDAERREKESAK